MKKIMIALAAVAIATVSQAAAVTWQSGAIANITSAKAIQGSLWEITATEYATYAAMDAETLSQTVAKAYIDGTLGVADATGENTYTTRSGAALNIKGSDSYGSSSIANAYGLLLYYDTTTELYMANVAQAVFSNDQNKNVTNLSNVLGGGTSGSATAWAAAVPEPTSGLLMLLGMAGLALRRRRA